MTAHTIDTARAQISLLLDTTTDRSDTDEPDADALARALLTPTSQANWVCEPTNRVVARVLDHRLLMVPRAKRPPQFPSGFRPAESVLIELAALTDRSTLGVKVECECGGVHELRRRWVTRRPPPPGSPDGTTAPSPTPSPGFVDADEAAFALLVGQVDWPAPTGADIALLNPRGRPDDTQVGQLAALTAGPVMRVPSADSVSTVGPVIPADSRRPVAEWPPPPGRGRPSPPEPALSVGAPGPFPGPPRRRAIVPTYPTDHPKRPENVRPSPTDQRRKQ